MQHCIDENEKQLLEHKASVSSQQKSHESVLKEHFCSKNKATNSEHSQNKGVASPVGIVMSKAVPIPVTESVSCIIPSTRAVVVQTNPQIYAAEKQLPDDDDCQTEPTPSASCVKEVNKTELAAQ